MTVYDCTMCGACCFNSRENVAAGYRWYVEIDDPDSQLISRKQWRKYLELDPNDTPHVRILDDGRCAALKGRLGQRVHCDVYKYRPSCCKRVEPGDPSCLQARRERGLED
jgi:Fe-S-cluster containining protein